MPQAGKNSLPTTVVPIGSAVVTMPDGTKQTVDVTLDPQFYRYFLTITRALQTTKAVLVAAGVAQAGQIPDV